MNICEKCKNKHDGSFATGRFCSVSCANSRTWSEIDKNNKRISAKKSKRAKVASLKIRKRFNKKCPICKSPFEVRKSELHKIYCSRRCFLKDSKRVFRKKHLSGGYRNGSGSGKSGYWKGFYCNSTYELAFLIWNLKENKPIKSCHQIFSYFFNNKKHNYHPDFEIYNTIYEIKGYYIPIVDVKLRAVRGYGKKIKILYLKDIKHMIDYVKLKYGVNRLEKLYEDYEPTMAICKFCKKEFSFTTGRSGGIFCSRHCSGRGRHMK